VFCSVLYCDSLQQRDSSSTAALIVCGTIGESVFPVVMGWAMGRYGYSTFPACMVGLAGMMIVCYALAHSVGTGLLHNLLRSRRPLQFLKWGGEGERSNEMSSLLNK
jgi:hypothetical protein